MSKLRLKLKLRLRDEEFSRRFCHALNIPIEVFTVDVAAEAKRLNTSVEDAGRIVRYKCFDKIAVDCKIATAHNLDDNAETVLMRVARGTGIRGLGGIAPVRGNIVRPLINCTRAEIEQYCMDNNLSFVQDSSNLDTAYTRNKIRLELLPWLKENLNPSVSANLSAMAEIMIKENNFIDDFSASAFKSCTHSLKSTSVSLDADKLSAMHPAILSRVLMLALAHLKQEFKDVTNAHITQLEELIRKQTGSEISLAGGIVAQKNYNLLILKTEAAPTPQFCHSISLNILTYIPEIDKYVSLFEIEQTYPHLTVEYTKWLNCDNLTGNLNFRTRQPGDRVRIEGVGTKKLKDLFIDMKISQDKRAAMPIISDDSGVVFVARLEATYPKYDPGRPKWCFQIWRKL